MIARRSLWVVGNSALGAVMGYVSLFLMARYMGDELLGAREYVLAIAFLLGLGTRLGFPTTHARRLGGGEDVPGSNGTYLAIKLALTGGFVVLAATVLWVWFDVLRRPATDITETALWLGVAVIAVRSLRDFATNTFRGLHRIVEREAILFTNTAVTMLLTGTVAVAYAHSHGRWIPFPTIADAVVDWFGVTGPVDFPTGLAWLMGAFLAGEVAALVLAWGLFLGGRVPVGRPDASIARDYLHATAPIMFVTLAGILMRRIDTAMIGYWHAPGEVGQYVGATKLTELVLILANGIRIVLLPLVSRLHKEGREDEMHAVLLEAERWISVLVWPVLVFGWTATTPILHIVLSDQFLDAAPVFALLLWQSLLVSLTIPLRTKALGIGRQRFAAHVALWALLLNVALNLALIPDSVLGVRTAGLGAVGAAIATVAAGAFMAVTYRVTAHRWTGHPYGMAHLLRHAAAGGATFAVLVMARPLLPGIDRFYDLAWYGTLVLALYVALLAALGGFHRGDWTAVRRMLAGRSPKTTPEVPPS